MIITIALVLFSLMALAVILFATRGRGGPIANLAELQGRIRPVDILAFRNLVDPDEECYLREHLPREAFRAVQRERMQVAIEYVQCVAGNAALLLRLGEAARESTDAEVAQAGRDLVESALRLRILALSAGVRLRARVLMPGLRVSPIAVSNSYERMTGLVGRLGRLQHRQMSVAS
jgi:hypothetical protein